MEPNNKDKKTKQHCLLPPQPYPWLLCVNSKGKKNQTFSFCSISDPTKTYSRSIPELRMSKLWTVQHGWCLFANKIQNTHKGAFELFLWNPSDLKKIVLPPLKHNGFCKTILSCSPTATDQVCSVFLFSAYSTSTLIFYCQLGDKQWTEFDYHEDLANAAAELGEELNENHSLLENPVYCNGCLYAKSCFGYQYFLVVIEKLQPHGLKIINSSRVPIPKLSIGTSFDATCTLLESNNELFQIEIWHAQNKVIAVIVHKLDFSQLVWEKVESIKGRVFFISNIDLSFSCQAINPETEGDRIYFNLENNNFVYAYNIEDNSLNISQSFSNLSKRWSSFWWFMTNIRITGSHKEEKGLTQISSVGVYSKEMVDDEAFALPQDMVEEIAKHLNSIDCLRHFRATNRLFRAAAPLTLVSRLSLSPLLVCFEKDSVLTIAHPKHGLKYKYSINLPKDFETNCEICYSKDGWLLMAANTLSNIFFNPFTREVKELAYGPLIIRNTRCVGFSHPPTSSECVVVEFNKMETSPPGMMASITKLGMEQWGFCSFEDTHFALYNMSPAYYEGKFYYISEEGMLGVLEIDEERVCWEELEELYAPCTGYYNSFLVECNGSLLSVFEDPFEKLVQVFKLNESKTAWVKVESLGNHMLFVGNTSLSAVANIPGMENKIYFPKFFDDEDIVFYSLETNKYHTFKNEVVNFHQVSERLNCSWIVPRWN